MTEEQVIIIDDNNNQVGIVPRSVMREKMLLHRASAILVFNSKKEIFVHQRSFNVDRLPGYFDLKAGGVVAAGETIKENALREVKEELGLKNPRLNFLFSVKSEGLKTDAPSFQNVFQCLDDGPINLQKEEITQGMFLPIHKIKELIQKEKFVPEAKLIFNKYLEEYHGH